MQQDIVDALGKATREYQDETPKEKRTDADVTAVMRAAVRSKTSSLRGQFAKHLAVANPYLTSSLEINSLMRQAHFFSYVAMHFNYHLHCSQFCQ
jgi:hypothetical protein